MEYFNAYEYYSDYLVDFINKVGVCKLTQLIKLLKNKGDKLDDKQIEKILNYACIDGKILVSQNDYVLSKYKFADVGVKRYQNDLSQGDLRRIQSDYLPKKIEGDIIDCLWIVIDLMPDSQEFSVGDGLPWSFSWLQGDGEECKVIQLCRIPDREEVTREALIASDELNKHLRWREKVSRIALVDRVDKLYLVPKLGFRNICMLDDSVEAHFKLVEQRNDEDMWSNSVE